MRTRTIWRAISLTAACLAGIGGFGAFSVQFVNYHNTVTALIAVNAKLIDATLKLDRLSAQVDEEKIRSATVIAALEHERNLLRNENNLFKQEKQARDLVLAQRRYSKPAAARRMIPEMVQHRDPRGDTGRPEVASVDAAV